MEERAAFPGPAERQFVWGVRYVDELVLRDRDTDGDETLDERLYALQDANYNVTAITDAAGAVVERFGYDAYGRAEVMDGSWGNRTASAYDWEVRYAGYRWDSESGLYQVRWREITPAVLAAVPQALSARPAGDRGSRTRDTRR